MPKKIKKDSTLKKNDEKLIRVDNIHYIFIAVITIVVLICGCVGGYVYYKDKYHAHASVAFESFTYTEKVNDGYNVYEVVLDDNKVYTYLSTPDSNSQKKWTHGKYLDFNEELYMTGILDYTSQVAVDNGEQEIEWSLEVDLITGDKIYFSNNSVTEIDKTQFAELIYKYFKQEIVYK